jgi:hypothetical protein
MIIFFFHNLCFVHAPLGSAPPVFIGKENNKPRVVPPAQEGGNWRERERKIGSGIRPLEKFAKKILQSSLVYP